MPKKAEAAVVVKLSTTLDAILYGRGSLMLVRSGSRVLLVNDREALGLAEAITGYRNPVSPSPAESAPGG